ncbi:MAG: lysis protein, partial [Pseudomonadota bacterium]
MVFSNNGNVDQAEEAPAGGSLRAGRTVILAQDGVVNLPPDAVLSGIAAEDADLVILLADGSRIVVPEGTVSVPEIVVDGVALEPQTVSELLLQKDLEPSSGDIPSSGGNFIRDEGEIQAAFDIGDLLPFTDFDLLSEDEEEVFPGVDDDEPIVLIQTGENPIGVQDAVAFVDEAGLPARLNEPAGSDEASDSESTSGTILIDTGDDALSSLAINGVDVTNGGTVDTDLGSLNVVITDGVYSYTYDLIDNTLSDPDSDVFEVVVSDSEGDTATASLVVSIIDDVPSARADIDSVTEDGPLVADGNVLTGAGGSDANASDGVADTEG